MMDRIDSNGVLSVVSKSLQQCLRDAIDIAAGMQVENLMR